MSLSVRLSMFFVENSNISFLVCLSLDIDCLFVSLHVDFEVFSEHELMFTFAICRRPFICLSPVTFVHPAQPAEIFGNVSMPFGTLADIQVKFYGDRSKPLRRGC